MKKKLLLLSVTLAVLLIGVYAYRQYLGADFVDPRSRQQQEHLDIEVDAGTVGSLPIGQSDQPTWMAMTDTSGRRQAVFKAASRREQDGRQVLTEPEIEIYLSNGGTLAIAAERASLVVDDVGSSVEPRRGTLTGKVRIRIIPAEEAARIERGGGQASLSDARADLEIATETMNFDNELQEISAPGRVELLSEQFRAIGSDLLIQWNTAPAELRLLRLAHGDRVEYRRKAGASLTLNDRATGSSGAATPEAAGNGAGADAAAEKNLQHYVLQLSGDVTLTSERQSVSGADAIEIVTTLRQRGGSDILRSSDAAKPASADGETKPASSGGPNVQMENAGVETAVLTWSGPLTIRPFKPEPARPAPAVDQYEVVAVGETLSLRRDEMNASCRTIRFFSESNRAEIEGDEDRLVAIDLGRGRRLNGRKITLNDQAMTLDAEGRGWLEIPSEEMPLLTAPGEGDPEPAAAGINRIDWTTSVSIHYEKYRDADDAQRRRPVNATLLGDVKFLFDDAQITADRMEIRFEPIEATALSDRLAAMGVSVGSIRAFGNAHLRQLSSGESVMSETMELLLSVDENGRQYPTQAVASGRVEAENAGSRIEADSLNVAFEHVEFAPDGSNFRPIAMVADGSVLLSRIASEPTDVPFSASGRRLYGDLIRGVHTLSGDDDAPALLMRGEGWAAGREIIVYTADHKRLDRAEMPGPGRAVLMMDRDLEGNPLNTPRPARLQWDGLLEYRGREDTLIFNENVRLDSADGLVAGDPGKPVADAAFDSPGDHMRCGRLEALLRGDSLDRVQGAQAVSRLTAVEDVRMLVRRDDEQGYMIGRLRLQGRRMVLNQVSGEFRVHGAGVLSVEDYRDPDSGGGDGADGAALGYAGPSQTVFAWQGGLSVLSSAALTDAAEPASGDWTVLMEGDVVVRHRGGGEMAGLEGLAIRPGLIDKAESTARDLDCDQLLIGFVQDDQARRQLDVLDASGHVVLVDGAYEFNGGRIVYDGLTDRAVLLGGERDDEQADAKVYVRQADGAIYETSSRTILLRRRRDAYLVDALNSSGRGAR